METIDDLSKTYVYCYFVSLSSVHKETGKNIYVYNLFNSNAPIDTPVKLKYFIEDICKKANVDYEKATVYCFSKNF